MLTLTDSASTVVKTITGRTPDVQNAGLRISADEVGAVDFAVAIAPAPEPTDTVVESSGAKVYLEENAAVTLDDKVLDAQVADDGSVQFSIGNQS
jgi:iron-sulfur cluster assembly protein